MLGDERPVLRDAPEQREEEGARRERREAVRRGRARRVPPVAPAPRPQRAWSASIPARRPDPRRSVPRHARPRPDVVPRRRADRGEPPIAMIHDRSFTSVAHVVAHHPFVRRDANTVGPALLCAGFGGILGGLALLILGPSAAGRPHAVIRLATAAALGHGLGDFLAKHLLQLDAPQPDHWCAHLHARCSL